MRENSQRAQTAVIFIGIIMFLDLLSTYLGYRQLDLLNRINDGMNITDVEIESHESLMAIMGIGYMVVYIASVVCFIRWFRRAYFNLHLKVKGLDFTEGWAAGAWFIPFLNLFRPYQIMSELYNRTFRFLRDNIEGYAKKGIWVVGLWWFFWVANNLIANFSLRLGLRAETMEDLLFSSQLDIFTSVIGIPLGFLAIKVIKDYSAMEEKLYELDRTERLNTEMTINDLDFDGSEDILDALN